jgi:hypothetical protein
MIDGSSVLSLVDLMPGAGGAARGLRGLSRLRGRPARVAGGLVWWLE